MSQKALALAARVSPSEVCNIERNMRSPHTDTLQKLAAALEVSVSFLLGEFNSDVTLPRALARESFSIFAREASLTQEQEGVLRQIRESDSAPRTVTGWAELVRNLSAYDSSRRRGPSELIFTRPLASKS